MQRWLTRFKRTLRWRRHHVCRGDKEERRLGVQERDLKEARLQFCTRYGNTCSKDRNIKQDGKSNAEMVLTHSPTRGHIIASRLQSNLSAMRRNRHAYISFSLSFFRYSIPISFSLCFPFDLHTRVLYTFICFVYLLESRGRSDYRA
jgi:hypothetical protein